MQSPVAGFLFSPAAIRESFLDPSMEATAHNLDQFNASPEVDSILEFQEQALQQLIAELDQGSKAHRLAQRVRSFTHAAIESNHREGSENLFISGRADLAARTAQDQEANGTRRCPGAVRLSKQLREPLKVLASPGEHDVAAVIDARNVWRDIKGSVPLEAFRNPTLHRQLGVKLTAVLEGLTS
jgi:hypothetical protein